MRIGLFNVLWLPLASLLVGCTTAPFCEELKACGGNFLAGEKDLGGGVTGTEWSVNTLKFPAGACIDQVPAPPEPPSLSLIPARPAGTRAVEPSTTDWCGGLVVRNDGTVRAFDDGWYETLKKYRGWFPSVPLYTAHLVVDRNERHTFQAKQLVATHYEISPTCRYAQGVVLECAQLGKEIEAHITTRLAGLMSLSAVVYDFKCEGGLDAPCICDYHLELTTSTSGPYSFETGVISFFDTDAAPPARSDYCVNGSTLQLSGENGTDLFNRQALKTLQLQPATCSDGWLSKSLGETGIDCGGACAACP